MITNFSYEEYRRISKALSKCKPVPRFLKILLFPLKALGFFRVRYYRYSEVDTIKKLECISSAGYSDEMNEYNDCIDDLINCGFIFHTSSIETSKENESFLCVDKKIPVIIEYRDNPEYASRKAEEAIHVMVPRTKIEKGFQRLTSLISVDFPLIHQGKCLGKISCDWRGNEDHYLPPLQTIAQFQTLIPVASLFIAALKQEVDQKSKECIKSCTSISDLFDVCVHEIAKNHFGADAASVFTVESDDYNYEKLILRRTSFEPIKGYENQWSYRPEEEGLTAYVAKHKMPLRLPAIGDKIMWAERFAEALGMPIMKWVNRIKDTKTPGHFLAVPIMDGEVILGVLRLGREPDRGVFTDQEIRSLQVLATEYIAPKMQEVRQREFSEAWLKHQQAFSKALLENTTPYVDLPNVLCSLLEEYFESSSGQKAFIINMLEPEGRTFRRRAIGGTLKLEESPRELKLEGTITEESLETFKSVYVHDLKKALKAKKARKFSDDARSALACQIAFQGEEYGAILIVSDKYDLAPEIYGRVIESLAAQAGEFYSRRFGLTFLTALNGMRHDFIDPLESIKAQVKLLVKYDPSQKSRNMLYSIDFLQMLIEAYCTKMGHSAKQRSRDRFELWDLVYMVMQAVDHGIISESKRPLDIAIDQGLWVDAPWAATGAILYNLIKNARRAVHDSDGKIQVRAEVLSEGDDEWLHLFVEDDGPGITAEKIDAIFANDVINVFQDRWSVETSENGGLGIPLARTLANSCEIGKCRGTLKYNNLHGATGSQFLVRIPIGGYKLGESRSTRWLKNDANFDH